LKFRSVTLLTAVIFSLLFILAGCGHQPTAQDRLNQYVKAWQKQDYAKMYSYLSSNAQKSISKADFVTRYQTVYGGIAAGKLSATVKQPAKDKQAAVPLKATLQTAAGPVTFSQTIQMTQQKSNKETNWYVNWQPSLILPGMKTGDMVRMTIVPAKRGEILDRNGKPLAIDGTAARIDVVPGELGKGTARTKTISQLAKVLNITSQSIEDAMKATWVKSDSLVPVRTVSGTDRTLIRSATTLPGVYRTAVSNRVYPDGQASGHLTGYVGPITADLLKSHQGQGYNDNSVIGRTGLEQLYENQLRAQDGAVIHLYNAAGNEYKTVAEKQPKDGQNIQLTVDTNVQDAMYNEMKKVSGAAVAINPATGDILGLVSAPSYDPNQFALGISASDYKKLNTDPQQPLLNRFSGITTPGSTFKPITAAIGLNHNAINPSQQESINGLRWQQDKSWGNFYVTRLDSAPKVDLESALYMSDNIYFAQAALKIGGTAFAADSKLYGFGETLPVPYPMQQSTISNDGTLNNPLLLANSGYGQGQVSVNPLHLSLIYSAFVNDGSIIRPRLIKTNAAPQMWKKNVMSPQVAQLLNKDLIQVVSNPAGTGHSAQISGVTLAGKTGTAEFKQKQNSTGRENGWFIAYNAGQKNLLVTMMVENTQKSGGSHVVTPKVKTVFQKVLNK
jgi:Cell division protein FtsI/penicillin-binding protein 2